MKIVGLGGEPGTGKSTIGRAIHDRLPLVRSFLVGCSPGPAIPGTIHRLPNGSGIIRILGIYDDRPYPGTDRIDMRAPKALPDVLERWSTANEECVVFFEGDRFFTATLATAMLKIAPNSRFFWLQCSAPVLNHRRQARNDTKTPTYMKAKRTQIANAVAAAGPAATPLANETPRDLEKAVQRILAEMGV